MRLQFLDWTAAYRALVLWFVAMTFLRTAGTGSNPLLLAASLVAVAVSWGVPLFLVAGVAGELYVRTVGASA